MDDVSDNPLVHVLWPTAAVLIVTILARRGLFRPATFLGAPQRRLPLAVVDLLPVAAFWIIGQTLAAGVFEYLGPSATTQPAAAVQTPMFDPMTRRFLTQTLLQIGMHLPLLAFVIWALVTRPIGQAPAPLAAGLRHIGILPGHHAPTRLIGFGLLGLVVSLPIVFGVNEVAVGLGKLLGQQAPESGHKLLDEVNRIQSPMAIMWFVASVAIVAPMFEEFIYRGVLQSCLRNALAPWPTILLAGVVFALMHASVAPVQVLPGLFSLGVILGWLYERTGSLWPGITLHAGFNLANLVLYYILSQQQNPTTQPGI